MTVHCPYCECKLPDPAKASKPRSYDQLKRYMALCKAAFEHWPESHPSQFADWIEARKWLQMKAGYREIASRIPLAGIPPEKARFIAEISMRAAGSYAVPVVHGGDLVIFKPLSIAYDALKHIDFCRLNDLVDEVIFAETGLKAEQLLDERERAA
jgi:hypothetical protein